MSCPNSVPRLSDWIPPPDAPPKKEPRGNSGEEETLEEGKGQPDPKACTCDGRRQTDSDRLVFFSLCPSRPIERNTHSGLVPRKTRECSECKVVAEWIGIGSGSSWSGMGDIEGSKPQKPPPATFEWIGHQRRKTIKKEPIKSTQKNLGARERVHFFV